MKFNIKDFAKIKEANVEIKGITVIAGENNTGKSTVGKALYSMYTAFHDLDDKVLLERKKAIMRSVYFDNDKSIRHQSIGSIGDIVKALLFDEVKSKDDIIERFKDANIVIDDNVADKIYTTLKFDKIHLEELVIRNIFNEEFNNQILPLHNENVNSVLELFVKDKQISVKFNNKETQFNKNIDLYYDGIYIDNPFILDQIYINENEEESIDDIYFKLIYDYRKAYNHKVTLQKKLSKSLKKKNNSLIENAIQQKRIENFLNLLRETIHGDFVERDDKFIFSDDISGANLELSNLSTGIKSFAVILKLLENNDIKDHSLIILDEPEVHLHPKWQLKFAEILIMLQKEFDLNILLTTHSPYFINALEVYSKEHNIGERMKYYLAYSKKNLGYFDDVTTNTDRIYELLAEPFKFLASKED